MPDRDAGFEWAAFYPHGTVGGSYAPDGRLIADSGVFNVELLIPANSNRRFQPQ